MLRKSRYPLPSPASTIIEHLGRIEVATCGYVIDAEERRSRLVDHNAMPRSKTALDQRGGNRSLEPTRYRPDLGLEQVR